MKTPNGSNPYVCHSSANRVFETYQFILVPEYLNWNKIQEGGGEDEEDENLYMNLCSVYHHVYISFWRFC